MSSILPAEQDSALGLSLTPHTSIASSVTCRNCGGPVGEQFCGSCGQRHALNVDPTLRDIVSDAADEFLSVDGKIVETLRRLITAPGALTAEHLSGRRARYVAPLRLYFTCSVLYFLLVAFTPSVDRRELQEIGRNATTLTAPTARNGAPTTGSTLLRGLARLQTDPAATARAMQVAGPRVMFALVPFFALLLYRAYRREGRRYPAHLYFALHVFSFYFLISIAQRLVKLTGLPGIVQVSSWIVGAAMVAYVALALERVYGTTRRRAVLRTALLLAQFTVVMSLTMAVTLLVMLGTA